MYHGIDMDERLFHVHEHGGGQSAIRLQLHTASHQWVRTFRIQNSEPSISVLKQLYYCSLSTQSDIAIF